MFNRDFFPTPEQTADMMQLDVRGKVVLEPSAGSGNLIEYMRKAGVAEVLACEKDERLAEITKAKADRFLSNDFLDVHAYHVSHIDAIVMNPPFSTAASHILHAYAIAPEGCEITALCNWDSIAKYPTGRYKELERLIENYGWMDNLGETFTTAERKTNVTIALIKLYKPLVSDSAKFDDFYMEDEEQAGEYGIMGFSDIQRVVGLYRGAVQSVKKVFDAGRELNQYTKEFKVGRVAINMEHYASAINEHQFAVALQKKAWKDLFAKLDMKRYVTSQVMNDINTFCERQHNVPFTVRNIRKMFEILIGTREETYKRSLVEAVDNFTRYTDENRYGLPGWKTNSGYLLNRKIIVDRIVTVGYHGGLRLQYNGYYEQLNDLTKVLCNMTGKQYTQDLDLWRYFSSEGNGPIERGQWYDWGFFQFKCFFKGTMHLKFKDAKEWEQLNRAYAKIKGQVLPEKI